jgi:hypothetical protein
MSRFLVTFVAVLITIGSIVLHTTSAEFTCNPECKNNGKCTSKNICTCATGFSGPTCEIQSAVLCSDTNTFKEEPILLVTFGSGSDQYSKATPADFDFTTNLKQQFAPVTNDGQFSFVNSVHDDFSGAWHTGALDHTESDKGGYMFLVNSDYQPHLFFNGTINNLRIGLRYEFSVYLANLMAVPGILPNVLFEVRSLTSGNNLLAQLTSGDVPSTSEMTWAKYGLSFTASSESVNLLMISNAPGGYGNDLAIDDITLRVCDEKALRASDPGTDAPRIHRCCKRQTYELEAKGVIHTTGYSCNDNPKNGFAGTCILPFLDGLKQCDNDPECGGFGFTTNVPYHAKFDGKGLPVIELFKNGSLTNANPEWDSYRKVRSK